jgi:hypothetical protein
MSKTPYDDVPLEDEQLAGNEEDNDGLDEEQLTIAVSGWLTDYLYPTVGMDEPNNHAKIVDFIVEDVKASADPDQYNDGDFAIAFRRFLEKVPVKKYRHEN